MDWKQSISILFTGEASPDTPSVSFASEYDIRPKRNQAQSVEFFPPLRASPEFRQNAARGCLFWALR